jgi:hypothetical protein
MKILNKLLLELICIMVLIVTRPTAAHAYLDPGTGSYILQLVIAGLLGSLFLVKSMWSQIEAFFVRLFSKKCKEENNDESNDGK